MSGASAPPLRAIVVGSGFGARIQLPAMQAAGFEVVGLVGTNAERTSRRAANLGVEAFTDLLAAITRTGATAVAVSTPPATHAAVSIAAIEHGCHVLCEKPFAANLAEGRAMLAAATKANVVHMMGHEFRFTPQRALVARTVASGVIGEPRFFSLVGFNPFVASFAEKLPGWWFDPQAGGGWLGASGSHIIDQVRSEVGEFVAVSSALPHVSAAARAVEDSFVVRFELANGCQGVLQQTAGAVGPATQMFRIAGTKGTLWTEGSAVWVADEAGARELETPADLQLAPPPAADGARPELQALSAVEFAPYTALCRQFRDAIQGRASTGSPRAATFADGVAGMQVLDAIRCSAAEGGRLVRIDSM